MQYDKIIKIMHIFNKIYWLWMVYLIAIPGVMADGHGMEMPKPDYSVESSKAVIYLYRDNRVTASARPYYCYLNDDFISKLENGQYIRYVVDPVVYDYWVEMVSDDSKLIISRSYHELNVKAGEIYFIKHSPEVQSGRLIWKITIHIMPEDQAKKEITQLWYKQN